MGIFAEVNGTRLDYDILGTGPPLVLVHGFWVDQHFWEERFAALAQGFQVVRYDLRGFGKSDLPGEVSYSHTGDLAALLSELEIQRAHILGHSFGGEIAIDFALSHPERVDRLVLVGSSLGGYTWSTEWRQSWRPVFAEAAQSGMQATLPRLLTHPLFSPACEQLPVKALLERTLASYSGWHAFHKDPARRLDPPASLRLSQVQAPTLVMVGERDLPDFHAISNLLVQGIPNANKVELLGVGHLVPLEAPEQFTQIVENFLNFDHL